MIPQTAKKCNRYKKSSKKRFPFFFTNEKEPKSCKNKVLATYTENKKIIFNESEKKEMKKFVVNYDCMTNSDLAIFTAKEIVEYLNNGEYTDLDTAIAEELDRKLIYYDDQWELMKTYQTPDEANFNAAVEMFMEELYSIIDEEEIEEELEEQGEEL